MTRRLNFATALAERRLALNRDVDASNMPPLGNRQAISRVTDRSQAVNINRTPIASGLDWNELLKVLGRQSRRQPARSSNPVRSSCAPQCCWAVRSSCANESFNPQRLPLSAVFVRSTAGLAAGAGLATGAGIAAGMPGLALPQPAHRFERRLIVIMLRGALDGLSTVVPYQEAITIGCGPALRSRAPVSQTVPLIWTVDSVCIRRWPC